MSDEPWRRSATDLQTAIRRRELSCVEVMQAHLARIEAVNPLLNAIVTLDGDLGLREAAAADAALGRDAATGPLHGLPIAIKDLEDTAGMRTTYGSPIYRDHVPTADTLLVARLRRAGAIVIGKTNTPEFGAGSQTFNPRLRSDPQPLRPHAHPGRQQRRRGSRGRQRHDPLRRRVGPRREHPQPRLVLQRRRAAHLARPRPGGAVVGRVEPDGGARAAGAQRARTPPCCCGRWPAPIPRAPLSLDDRPDTFVLGDRRSIRAARGSPGAATSATCPSSPAVTAVLEDHRAALEAMGCVVEDVEPDLTAADDAFEVLRAVGFAQAFGPMLETHGDQFKETIVWNTRVGLALTGSAVARALGVQTEMFERMRSLLERYDALALPVSQVAPFAVEQEWVTEIAGTAMGSYFEWMRSCSRITVTAPPGPLAPRRLHPRTACPSDCSSSAATAASSPFCAWPPPSSSATGVGRRAPEL